MHIKKLKNDVYKIENVIDATIAEKLKTYLWSLTYKKKSHREYECSTVFFSDEENHKIKQFLNSYIPFIQIEQLLQEVYWKKLQLNSFGEIIQMQKGDFLNWHTDDYNSIQCVLHLKDYNTFDGGILKFRDFEVSPEKLSIICFSGKSEHSVTSILKDEKRYSISFGALM